MNQKHKQNIYHANINLSLMVKSVTEIKSGTTINVDVSVKIRNKIVCVKKLYLESCYM